LLEHHRCRRKPCRRRVRPIEGSFFDHVPAGGDAYFLKNIIHDWDDDASLQILRNVRAAATPGTALLLVDIVVPDDDRRSHAKLSDIEMLLVNNGQERTATEYRQLLHAAGFETTQVVDTASPVSTVEARAA
jgi:O-methyltransferase domain